ncbi:MAG: hypothetical protein CBC71_11590 [Rhodobacteraceae bacterium TMED111]|nr:MAG: hypothetical protein CBC71_11590 [Rhodobacteraceae bacterium TMED111]|tara:strand:- start:208 stop:495 length:288 start_codon:yes stop_codon:yes gene_type:complete
MSRYVPLWDLTQNQQRLYIACEDSLCALSMSNSKAFDLVIYFNRKKLKKWKTIQKQSVELIKSFETAALKLTEQELSFWESLKILIIKQLPKDVI